MGRNVAIGIEAKNKRFEMSNLSIFGRLQNACARCLLTPIKISFLLAQGAYTIGMTIISKKLLYCFSSNGYVWLLA